MVRERFCPVTPNITFVERSEVTEEEFEREREQVWERLAKRHRIRIERKLRRLRWLTLGLVPERVLICFI